MEFNALTVRKIAMDAKAKICKVGVKECPEFRNTFNTMIRDIQEDVLYAAENGRTDTYIRFARPFQDKKSALFADGEFGYDTPEYMLYEAVKTELSNLRFNVRFAINTTNNVYDIVEFKIAW